MTIIAPLEEDNNLFQLTINDKILKFTTGITLNDFEIFQGKGADKLKLVKMLTKKCINNELSIHLQDCDNGKLIELAQNYINEDDDFKSIYDAQFSADDFFKRFALTMKTYIENEVKEIRRQFGSVYDSYSSHFKVINNSTINFIKNNQSLLRNVFNVSESFKTQINSKLSNFVRMNETFKSQINSQLSNIVRINEDFKVNVTRNMANIINPINEIRNNLVKMGLTPEYVLEIKSSLQSMQNFDTRLIRNFQLRVETLEKYSLTPEEITVNNDGSITTVNETFSSSEVKRIVNEAIEENNIFNRFDNIDATLKKLSAQIGSKYGNMIFTIILSLIINFFSTHVVDTNYDYLLKTMPTSKKTQTIRTIQSHFEYNYKEVALVLKEFRIIKSYNLDVREYGNRSSKIISNLRFGDVV